MNIQDITTDFFTVKPDVDVDALDLTAKTLIPEAFNEATEIYGNRFGGEKKAKRFLMNPDFRFEGDSPLKRSAASVEGHALVMQSLGRIRHSIYG